MSRKRDTKRSPKGRNAPRLRSRRSQREPRIAQVEPAPRPQPDPYADIPAPLRAALDEQDAAVRVVQELQQSISPAQAATEGSPNQRLWELCGLHLRDHGRPHDAIAVLNALYEHMLRAQDPTRRVHKGMPLVWMSDLHASLRHPSLAKRYMMLTACEDAMRDQGEIAPRTGGAYFRLVWHYGLSHDDVSRYARRMFELSADPAIEARFPEAILQRLNHEWMTEYPSEAEAALYSINRVYAAHLVARLGEGDGRALEILAHYLLSCVPGCRAYMRRRSPSTDYDVVGALEGIGLDFRSDLGRYFLCECKDWQKPADFTSFAKFCRVLDSAKCRFGILFSRHGISGQGELANAEREQLKVFQDRGVVIVVISEVDLTRVARGTNFISMLREKYETVRLDLLS